MLISKLLIPNTQLTILQFSAKRKACIIISSLFVVRIRNLIYRSPALMINLELCLGRILSNGFAEAANHRANFIRDTNTYSIARDEVATSGSDILMILNDNRHWRTGFEQRSEE